MIRPSNIDMRAALNDREGIERACIAAAREVIRLHRFHQLPITGAENGETISVDEFEKRVNQREAELDRQFGRTPPNG